MLTLYPSASNFQFSNLFFSGAGGCHLSREGHGVQRDQCTGQRDRCVCVKRPAGGVVCAWHSLTTSGCHQFCSPFDLYHVLQSGLDSLHCISVLSAAPSLHQRKRCPFFHAVLRPVAASKWGLLCSDTSCSLNIGLALFTGYRWSRCTCPSTVTPGARRERWTV